jgi:hypothetical protein
MRILKMRNNADELFDQFVKKQLEQTEVGPELAQHYFDQMKLPPPSSGEGTVTTVAKNSRWRFWAGAVVVTAAAVIIYKTMQPQPSAQTPAKLVQPVAVVSDSDKRQISIPEAVAATPQMLPVTTNPNSPSSHIQKTVLPAKALAVADKTIAPADSIVVIPRSTVTDLPTHPPVVKNKDSLIKQLRPAPIIPKKATDSVYIIW